MTTLNDEPRQHGVRGVYYGGEWIDIEDCGSVFDGTVNPTQNDCDACIHPCPRSRTRTTKAKHYVASMNGNDAYEVYDIVLIGAGCIGASIARALCQIADLSILWVEAADDVSQGATKGNSGIVHAGYDDTPGSVRAQHCWKGNQMFAQLDRELRFGYQKNGSLVIATTQDEVQELLNLYQRGQVNGVQNLEVITDTAKLRQMEPYVADNAIAALYAPDAGNVIPYEFAIALAENAVDNGVELRIRTKVVSIDRSDDAKNKFPFTVHLEYWEPAEYVSSMAILRRARYIQQIAPLIAVLSVTLIVVRFFAWDFGVVPGSVYNHDMYTDPYLYGPLLLVVVAGMVHALQRRWSSSLHVSRATSLSALVDKAGLPVGTPNATSLDHATHGTVQHQQHVVPVDDMFVGGSGSANTWYGRTVKDPIATTNNNYDSTVSSTRQLPPRTNHIRCSYVINCAGGASDQVAAMIGDTSFHIKPRLGDYILLNRNQVSTSSSSSSLVQMLFPLSRLGVQIVFSFVLMLRFFCC
jgi:hypothetical protein